MKNNRIIAIVAVVVLIVILGVGGWYLFGQGGGSGQAIAVVNGETITGEQLKASEAQIEAQSGFTASTTAQEVELQNDALQSLIGQTLIKQAATKAGLTASSSEVAAQIASTKSQFSNESDFEQALAAQGLSESEFESQVATNVLVDDYLNQQLNLSAATATDAEIQSAYDQVASSSSQALPPLDQVKGQVAQAVVQQKQQALVDSYVKQLMAQATIQYLISTSTPAQLS